jgi:hypothetical protein
MSQRLFGTHVLPERSNIMDHPLITQLVCGQLHAKTPAYEK